MDVTAVEIAARVRAGELSALEVVRAALGRIRGAESLGAFAWVDEERALAQAEAVDAAVAQGEAGSLTLAGVPCPIKQLAEVEGLPYTGGSLALEGNVGRRTDAVARRLVEAGTVTVGLTTAPEFGFPCYTEPASGAVVTPWDRSRGAGGSSGGAAAAVAAGVVPIAHASDGGGSIRIPASSCGVVGLKPSRGLVSTLPGRVAGPGLVCDGVVSRTVRDTALALDALAGNVPGDTYLLPRSPSYLRACDEAPRRLRIGLLVRPVISETASVSPECIAAAEETAGWLETMGHEVAPAPVAFPPERWAAFQALWTTGAAGVPVPPGREGLLTPMTRWLREQGRQVSGTAFAEALGAVQALTLEVAETWADFDVVVTPTLARPPARVGELRDDDDPAGDFGAQIDYTPWTSIANLTGRPSISLPLHRATVEGAVLPIGVMLTGRIGEDSALLGLAAHLEAEHPWPLVAPGWGG